MLDLIVSVPDHFLSFYLTLVTGHLFQKVVITILC